MSERTEKLVAGHYLLAVQGLAMMRSLQAALPTLPARVEDMRTILEGLDSTATVFEHGSMAYGAPSEPETAWAAAAHDVEWLQEQEEFLELAADSDSEALDSIDD
jgi:hypothetical protein